MADNEKNNQNSGLALEKQAAAYRRRALDEA
jgi:hypothetical protein